MNSEKPRRRKAAAASAAAFVLSLAVAAQANANDVLLGSEFDECGGVLYVKNSNAEWVKMRRGGKPNSVDVHIDADGYWQWRCDETNERSRGAASYRSRVKKLIVKQFPDSRRITWDCYGVN